MKTNKLIKELEKILYTMELEYNSFGLQMKFEVKRISALIEDLKKGKSK